MAKIYQNIPKEDIPIIIKHMKMCLIIITWWNFKLQYVEIPISRTSRSKTWTVLNMANFAEELKPNCHVFLMGVQNGINMLQSCSMLSQKVKNISTILPSHLTPICLYTRNENICSWKVSHKKVPSSFIYRNPKLETKKQTNTQTSVKLCYTQIFMQYNTIQQ